MGRIGQTIIDLEEVDSTNLYAERLLRQGAVEEGLVIRAGFQTAGKGQGDNTWESEPGQNLIFSVVVHPRFLPPDRQFLINMAVSLGVADFLLHYVEEVTVKWPNDILVGNRKIGGILIQHLVCGEMLDASIAGVGLNINQTSFDHRLPDAASLIQILHQELVIKEALNQLCITLDERYSMLRDNHSDKLEADFCKVLRGFQEERFYLVEGQILPGVIKGVDKFGRLLVEHPGLRVKAYAHGEIAV